MCKHWGLDSRFKILYSHKPMHYNGTEIDTNIQYQYLHAHDKMMDVTQGCINKNSLTSGKP